MADDANKPPIDRFELAKATVAGAAAVAAAVTAGPVGWLGLAVGGGGAAGASLVNAMADKWRDRSARAARAWFDTMASDANTTPDAMADAIRDRIDDPDTLRVITDHVRRLQEIDPELAPALGALAAAYLKRAPDAFFRGATGLLVECTGSEARELRQLLEGMTAYQGDSGTLTANVRTEYGEDGTSRFGVLVRPHYGSARRPEPVGHFGDPVRLFEVLKRHLLGRDARGDTEAFGSSSAGPTTVELTRETAERLVALLRHCVDGERAQQ